MANYRFDWITSLLVFTLGLYCASGTSAQDWHIKELERSRLAEAKRVRIQAVLAAAQACDLQSLQQQLDSGFDVNETLEYESALSVSASANHLACVKYLLSKGARVNPDPVYSEKPLHAAARGGALETVRFLVDYGADVNWTDSRGLNALNSAAIWGQSTIVSYLISKGADVNLGDNRCKPPCASSIHQAAYSRAYDAFVALIRAGAKVDQQDALGRSALHWAVYSFDPAIVKLVIDRGASGTLKDGNGRTPAELARYLLSPEEFGTIRPRELMLISRMLDQHVR